MMKLSEDEYLRVLDNTCETRTSKLVLALLFGRLERATGPEGERVFLARFRGASYFIDSGKH